MATPPKVDDRLIRLLYLLVERHISLRVFNDLVREADNNVEIDANLEKFFRTTALHLTGKGGL